MGHLATVGRDGHPHVVPFCFVLDGDVVYSAVDAKPKTTTALRRVGNLRHHPRAALVVDHYEEDWTALWWVRLAGDARILDDGPERRGALALLEAKYPQYRADPPPGPVIAIQVTEWRAWP